MNGTDKMIENLDKILNEILALNENDIG